MNLIDENTLKGFKYFQPLWPMLKHLPPEESHPPRRLHYDQYLCFILFYFFNPTLTGVRSIQKASRLEKGSGNQIDQSGLFFGSRQRLPL